MLFNNIYEIINYNELSYKVIVSNEKQQMRLSKIKYWKSTQRNGGFGDGILGKRRYHHEPIATTLILQTLTSIFRATKDER